MKREQLTQEEIDALFRQAAAAEAAGAPFAPLGSGGEAAGAGGAAGAGSASTQGGGSSLASGAGPAPAAGAGPALTVGLGPAAGGLAAGGGLGAGVGLAPGVVAEDVNLRLLMDVELELQVELGRTRRTVREILGYGPGSVVELTKGAGEPVEILIGGRVVARGEVVVVGENFGVRITEILDPAARLAAAR